jgi:hypothetical protein
VTTFNLRDISKIPGKLCVNPTDLSTAFPHGGTGLGVVRNIVFRPEFKYTDIRAEEFGGERVESIATSRGCILTATLQSFDSEALREMFWNTEEGTVSGKRGVREYAAASNRAGFLLSSRSVVLLFSPDDTDRAPMLLIRRALPQPQESMEGTLNLNSDIAMALAWVGIRDTSGRFYEWKYRKDITLA